MSLNVLGPGQPGHTGPQEGTDSPAPKPACPAQAEATRGVWRGSPGQDPATSPPHGALPRAPHADAPGCGASLQLGPTDPQADALMCRCEIRPWETGARAGTEAVHEALPHIRPLPENDF